MTSIVLVGGGGHASVLLEMIRATEGLQLEGYVAQSAGALSTSGVPYLGDDGCCGDLIARGILDAALGVAGANDNVRRAQLFSAWKARGFRFVTLIHPSAIIASAVSRGEGLQCFSRVVVNPGCVLGSNVLLNTAAVVEHDCVVGDDAHIAPGAVLCGGVQVGARALVGAGATVLPGISIGADAIVGAGSVVTRAVPAGARVAGVPARAIRASGLEWRKA